MDGGDDNVCKAIEDLIKDSEAKGEAKKVFKLRREGHITIEVAVDEYLVSSHNADGWRRFFLLII